MKKQILTLILAITIILVMTSVLAGTITRTISGNTITYTASGVTGNFGASIQESITGGCSFPGNVNYYKSVMISNDGLTKSITINNPSKNPCTISGDYKFGTDSVISFPSATIGGTTDNTWMYILGGIIALVVLFVLFKK